MRKLLLVVGLALLAAPGCRGRAAGNEVPKGVPKEAFAPMTEDDVARFIAVLPGVLEHLESHGSGPEGTLKPRSTVAQIMTHDVEWVGKVDGIDELLKKGGADWPFFRAMLYRLTACTYAVGVEEVGEDGFKDAVRREPNGLMAKELRKRIKEMKAVGAAVPKENVEIFQRHFRDLHDFFPIVGMP
jgi:hypothetical protein